MNPRILLVLVAALALTLAACGDDDADVEATPDAADGMVDVDVSMQDLEFVPDSVEVPAGASVTFNLTNDGAVEHDLMFEDGSDSGRIAPGDDAVLEAGPFAETAVGWCDVPGHREAGMEFEVVVTD